MPKFFLDNSRLPTRPPVGRRAAFPQRRKAARSVQAVLPQWRDKQSAKARAEARHHRQNLTQRLIDAVKLVAAHYLRDEARAQAYFRIKLRQA